ncbi:DUF58 domain-containing protein [bacterium]|nr:MAG: DUF58 domain-containing protein [bacterium]
MALKSHKAGGHDKINGVQAPASLSSPARRSSSSGTKTFFASTWAKARAFLASVLPSSRLLVFFGLGSLGWVVAAFIPGFKILTLLFDLTLLLLALVDLAFSPKPHDFDLEREFNSKMNLGAPNNVTLRVKSRAKLPVSIIVRDEVPESFAVSNHQAPRYRLETPLPELARFELRVESLQTTEATYQLLPNRRGDFRFGLMHARTTSGLGFWHRQFERQVEGEARVYPDTTAVRRYEIALRDGKMRDIGLHLLRLRGRGTEFESLRDYTTDDEFKSINWKASARRGKLIATNYEIERDQTILICIDCGRMMTSMAVTRTHAQDKGNDGTEVAEVPLSKLDCAINATVLLSHVAASMGDSVGLLLFSDGVMNYLAPRKGRVQTGQIIEALYAVQPSLVEPDYNVVYEYILARRLRRSLVVTFTDIIDPEASRELLQGSATIRRHHNALCVSIANLDVMDLATSFPHSSGDLYDKAMAQRMLSQRGSALEALRAAGVGIVDARAQDLSVATVNRYLEMKSRGTM